MMEALKKSSKNTSVVMSGIEASQPLPPSSFQRFLRAQQIPGIVLPEHLRHPREHPADLSREAEPRGGPELCDGHSEGGLGPSVK
ncbi:Nicastrin, partial [Ophiophagus hannah]